MLRTQPQVAIIGRPNVGKSTLFNRLSESHKAIVSNVAGTTRDRNFFTVEWQGMSFELIDTGGITTDEKNDKLVKDIAKQATKALSEADLVLFVIDVRSGITKDDETILRAIKRNRKPTLVVANKADTIKIRELAHEYISLGFGDPLPVSGTNGSGTGDLLDAIVLELKKIKPKKREVTSKGEIKISIIGKPNVGKSTLVNAILNDEARITSPTEHTTRDAATLRWKYNDYIFSITDTAGLRRSNKARKFAEMVEDHSRTQSMRAINDADIVFLMVDISTNISFQDKHLISDVERAHAGIVLVANKWDLIEDKTTRSTDQYLKELARDFPFVRWVPKIFVSALNRQRVYALLDKAIEIFEKRSQTIPQDDLDTFLKDMVEKHKPSRGSGTKFPILFKLAQESAAPPRFTLYMDKVSDLHPSYIRFLEKNLRERFDFEGSSINITLAPIYKNDLV